MIPPDTGPDPEGALLDMEAIEAIHRDPDGYIGFCRKPDPTQPVRLDKRGQPYSFDNLFSFKASDLRGMFPAIAHWLTHDAYMTVNPSFRAAPYANSLTGHPDVWRKEKHLKALAACYADVDCGRPDSTEPGAALTWRHALLKAGLLADAGAIPQPSIMARSGQGCYLFWLLCDERDPEALPGAWMDSTIPQYKAINKALQERLRTHSLPADKVAFDAARILRVPGSIHRKAQRRVVYVIQADAHGSGFVYTLPELARFLDLPNLRSTLPEATRKLAVAPQFRRTRPAKNKGSAPRRSEGARQLNALRAADLLRLAYYHGGFAQRGQKHPDGSTSPGRRNVLSHYSHFLHGSGLDHAAVVAAVEALAADCVPPWPDDPGDPTPAQLVELEKKPLAPSNATLCRFLSITDDMCRELPLQTILTPDVRLEREAARPLQADLIEHRLQVARLYLQTPGDKTARGLARIYKAHGLTGANHETANQDLNHRLGYKVQNRGGRPRKDSPK